MGLIEADEMQWFMDVLSRQSRASADFELREVDTTDPGSDELLPLKGYVEIRCKPTARCKEYPTGDGTAWVAAFERDLAGGRFD